MPTPIRETIVSIIVDYSFTLNQNEDRLDILRYILYYLWTNFVRRFGQIEGCSNFKT